MRAVRVHASRGWALLYIVGSRDCTPNRIAFRARNVVGALAKTEGHVILLGKFGLGKFGLGKFGLGKFGVFQERVPSPGVLQRVLFIPRRIQRLDAGPGNTPDIDPDVQVCRVF
jgi:hypothetical protein